MRRGASVSQDFADNSVPRGAFTTRRLGRSSLRANRLLLCRRSSKSLVRHPVSSGGPGGPIPWEPPVDIVSRNPHRLEAPVARGQRAACIDRSEEHASELQSLMRNSYAVFCLKKKKKKTQHR